MKGRIETAFTGMLVACAVVMTVVVVRAQGRVPPTSQVSPAVEIAGWRAFQEVGVSFGAPEAAITVTVFSDFECPFCRGFHRTLQEVRRRNPDRVRVVFVHYPLNYHRFAIPAATAAECGERQGRFEDLADKLFELQDSLGLMTWTEIARRAKLRSIGEFEECISRPTPPARIAAGREAGDRMGVDGTPTVLVNAWRLGSAPASPEGLAAILDRVQEGRPPVEHE